MSLAGGRGKHKQARSIETKSKSEKKWSEVNTEERKQMIDKNQGRLIEKIIQGEPSKQQGNTGIMETQEFEKQ